MHKKFFHFFLNSLHYFVIKDISIIKIYCLILFKHLLKYFHFEEIFEKIDNC